MGKKSQIEIATDKLSNGLLRIDGAKKQVSEMSVNLEQMKAVVNKKQIECEKLLVLIIQQKRDADEKRIKCEIEQTKMAKEEKLCAQLAKDAHSELDSAMPALEAAMDALNGLSKEAVTEIKSYAKPPPAVGYVMSAVLILLSEEDTSWASAKKLLSDANFLSKLKNFDKDNISNNVLKKIKQFTTEIETKQLKAKSIAGAVMFDWVIAMESYAQINRAIEPKRIALDNATPALTAKQASLRIIRSELQQIEEQIATLQASLDQNEKEKASLEEKSETLELKLLRAAQLIEGLSSNRNRWEIDIKKLKQN